jgi:hypothetical protein
VAISSEFKNKLSRQINDIPKNANRAQGVYDRLAPLLNKYRGGMPAGFLAAIASFESGGKMSSTGDAALGEIGIFQITRTFPKKVGLPAESRRDKETNVFLGGIEYQIMAVRMHLASPVIPLGTADNWKLARLAFAVGEGGTRKLLRLSGARSYAELASFVTRAGGVPLGRQSAGKVWFRVQVIEVLWAIGQLVKPSFWIGSPVKIPNSPAGAYTLPKDVAPFLPSPLRGPLIGLGIGATAIILA